MGLLDEVKSEMLPRGPKCTTCVLIGENSSLSETDRDELAVALKDPSVQGSAIARVLRARGISTTSTTISRHRREHK